MPSSSLLSPILSRYTIIKFKLTIFISFFVFFIIVLFLLCCSFFSMAIRDFISFINLIVLIVSQTWVCHIGCFSIAWSFIYVHCVFTAITCVAVSCNDLAIRVEKVAHWLAFASTQSVEMMAISSLFTFWFFFLMISFFRYTSELTFIILPLFFLYFILFKSTLIFFRNLILFIFSGFDQLLRNRWSKSIINVSLWIKNITIIFPLCLLCSTWPRLDLLVQKWIIIFIRYKLLQLLLILFFFSWSHPNPAGPRCVGIS